MVCAVIAAGSASPITHPGEVAEVAGKDHTGCGHPAPTTTGFGHRRRIYTTVLKDQSSACAASGVAPGRGDVLGQLPGGPQPRDTIQAELGQRPGQRARITAGLYTPCTREPGNALIPGDGATGDQASHNRLVRQRLLYGTRKPMSD